MRICSLLPSATEIAFALGLDDSVVAVTHECDYPPQARSKRVVVKSSIDPASQSSAEIDKSIGERLKGNRGVYTIDLPRLREADPDLILTQELCDVCAVDYDEVLSAARSLARRPKIISLTPTLLAGVLRDIELVGEATGKQREAGAVVGRLSARIDRVREQAAGAGYRPRVACMEWLDPIYIAGHWIPEMVELAGGRDELGKKGLPSEKTSWDRVVQSAPEVIVLMPCGFEVERTMKELELLPRLPGWADLPAVRERRVFAVNGSAYFNRPGPRLVDGLEILARLFHPKIFPAELDAETARRVDPSA
ncbi:MAG: cobalamin-binding protein [Deltaproteobacteria bacterium]|nr:cobalamin-binding protein [Deltaproteobacteria bacterium]